jgi:hypothetical protein
MASAVQSITAAKNTFAPGSMSQALLRLLFIRTPGTACARGDLFKSRQIHSPTKPAASRPCHSDNQPAQHADPMPQSSESIAPRTRQCICLCSA